MWGINGDKVNKSIFYKMWSWFLWNWFCDKLWWF